MNDNWITEAETSDVLKSIETKYSILFENQLKFKKYNASFFPEYILIEAIIAPQIIKKNKEKRIEKETLSLMCLYNPGAENINDKIKVPYQDDVFGIGDSNTMVKKRLKKENVVEYIKYFGYITRLNYRPFLFFNNVNEIPWKKSATASDKEQLLSVLKTFYEIKPDGEIEILINEEKSIFGLRKLYSFDIPVILMDNCYSATIRVSNKGYVDMDENSNLLHQKDIIESQKIYPFLSLYTGFKHETQTTTISKINQIKNRGAGCLLLIISPVIWSFLLLCIISFVDLFLILRGDIPYSEKLNNFVGDNTIFAICALTGSLTYITWRFYDVFMLLFSKWINEKTPTVLNTYDNFKRKSSNRRQKLKHKVIGVFLMMVLNIFALTLVWNIIWITLDNVFNVVKFSESSLSIGSVYQKILSSITIEFVPQIVRQIKNIPSELTVSGQVLVGLLKTYMGFVVFRYGKFLWDEENTS